METKKAIEIVDKFVRFGYNANKDIFKVVFGSDMGEHLWSKFVNDYDRDISRSFGYMDNNNRKLLVEAITDESLLPRLDI